MLHITPMSRRRWRIAAIACALPVAMLLAGCGKKQAEPAVVGQVIAHVGPDDVTQQELDNELRLANVPADKRSDPIVKAALSRIVERKYLVQQAIAAKLDREPTVHLDLLRSREQILAGAFVQRDLSSKMSSVSKNEIDSYVQGHPKQFDQRELFQVDQISFTSPKDVEALAAATKDFKSLDQVEAKLNEHEHQIQPRHGDLGQRDNARRDAEGAGRPQTRRHLLHTFQRERELFQGDVRRSKAADHRPGQ